MPAVNRNYKKYCETCGKCLIITINRDIIRKRFCSRSCGIKAQHKEGVLKKPTGNKAKNWRGGRIIQGGYTAIWVAPKTYKLEHDIIMEKHLGRKLLPNEFCHHKNGIKTDNRLFNLELWSRPHPTGIRVSDFPEPEYYI